MTSQENQDVLFETRNNAGIVVLNRPTSLNALNIPIVTQMLPKLDEWEKSKRLVIIKGAGKAFCAGGDVKDVVKAQDNVSIALVEYNVNYNIGNYKIPFIAFIDGITMGGGMGVSVHGQYRIATENTVIAMPEVKIGLIPDVGGTYFLPRLPFHLGYYLGLTGNFISGEDVVAIGVGTHFVSSHRLVDLENALSQCSNDEEVKAILNKFNEPIKSEFSLAPHVKDIDHCFSAPSVEEIIDRLTLVDNKWSLNTIKIIRQMCPLAVKLTLKALRKGEKLDLWQCLIMEYRLVVRLSSNYNFHEGVRAVLIDKDKKPKWIPKTVEEIKDNVIEPFFEPLAKGELTRIVSKL